MGATLNPDGNGSFFRFVINDLNNGVLVLSSGCVITDTNQRFCSMVGFSRDEMIGKPVTAFLARKNKERFLEVLEKKNGNNGHSFESPFRTKNGREIVFLITMLPVWASKSSDQKLIAQFYDISHYKKIQNDLILREKQLELITSKIEEVRTQVGLILGNENNRKLTPGPPPIKSNPGKNSKLTRSEMTVAEMVNSGKTTKEIASILCLSEKTVSNHRQSIRKKLGLVKKAVRNNSPSSRILPI